MASLAMGNVPPHAPAGLAPLRLDAGRYWPNPWDRRLADGLGDDDVVLVIGTGLTMVDVVLMLEAKQFGGRIVAISDSEIQLVEIISDGLGGYLERPAAIGLAD